MIKQLIRYLSKPLHLSILNGVLLTVLILGNSKWQVLCVPSPWAFWLLLACFLNTVLYPVVTNKKLILFTSFINGFSLFVFLYCIIFLGSMNFMGFALIFFLIGFLIYIPHFFTVQLLLKNLIRPVYGTARYFFLSGVALCLLICVWAGISYRTAIDDFYAFRKNGYERIGQNFMNEKILGMHLIYHTRFCEYDGWRPPKNEPLLVIGMWLNGGHDPMNISLGKRLELYKRFFPENTYKFDCSCSLEESKTYHNDPLWK